MKIIRIVAATLLALLFLFFGAGFFIHPAPLPSANGQPGIQLLHEMRDGGLTKAFAFSHVVARILLLIPHTRFLGALLQLPMTIGIVAFHYFMWRLGLPFAVVLLVLNLVALYHPPHLRAVRGYQTS